MKGRFEPFNHYGKSKLEAEYVYEAWRKADSANKLTIIRPTVVFGKATAATCITCSARSPAADS